MNNYFATVSRGLESVAARELEKIGAQDIRPDFTGVHFKGDKATLYKANLWTRTTFRILKPIARIKSYNGDELYRNVQKLDWDEYLTPDMTMAVTCTGKSKHLNHTHFTARRVKDAIVDQQQQRLSNRIGIGHFQLLGQARQNLNDPLLMLRCNLVDRMIQFPKLRGCMAKGTARE